MAYGTDLDREKLSVLAQLNGQSQSEWLVAQIRQRYEEAFGAVDPKLIITPNV